MSGFRLKISRTLYEYSLRLRWMPSTYYLDMTLILEVRSEQESEGRCGIWAAEGLLMSCVP